MSAPKTHQNTKDPKSNPCDTCKNKDHCSALCLARARWWDVQMEKIRKAVGV